MDLISKKAFYAGPITDVGNYRVNYKFLFVPKTCQSIHLNKAFQTNFSSYNLFVGGMSLGLSSKAQASFELSLNGSNSRAQPSLNFLIFGKRVFRAFRQTRSKKLGEFGSFSWEEKVLKLGLGTDIVKERLRLV